jgi:hypothetical protein
MTFLNHYATFVIYPSIALALLMVVPLPGFVRKRLIAFVEFVASIRCEGARRDVAVSRLAS